MDPKNIENKVVETVVDDESALDQELQASIDAVKAGNEPKVATPEVKTEVKEDEKSTDTTEEGTSVPPKEGEGDSEYSFRIPNKGKFESDESYEKRVELLDLVKRRKLAKTDEQKKELSDQISKTKSQLMNLNGSDKVINPLNKSVEDGKEGEVDEALKADQERLKQLGGTTKEDVQEILQQERAAAEVRSTLDKFIDRHLELKDEDTREVFFDFVDQNYNWQNKSGKDLMTVLELARESMFKPSETIQERVIKGANVQEKVNAMQFPGGTIVKNSLSPEQKKSVDELKATGISEEKALELISD